ncbi:hypothetical protein JW935_09415 [candidate division KSB1 bacterium]|nr:hypothetical protein [candidate division KSB1 bacterium]
MAKFKQISENYWKFGPFSYNPDNPDLFEDDEDQGLTLNFAHWLSCVVSIIIILSVVIIVVFASI